MSGETERLEEFFEQTKTLTLWKRIFGWSQFRKLSYEAYQEFNSLLSETQRLDQELDRERNESSVLRNSNLYIQDRERQQASELSASKEKVINLEQENSRLKEENIIFKQTEEGRTRDYESRATTLSEITTNIKVERQTEVDEQQRAEIERLVRLKETWAKHQNGVQEAIKNICQKHTIEYVERVPFKGTPDNAIKLCDEFIIFDAKSPASDDLANFPTYIKNQTDSVKKYIKEENVKKDIFLVIPSNTVDVIQQFTFNMGAYNVYVVTLDSLEPIMLCLKKLEDYEFVDQLSPEERDNVCRVIGRFAHMTKRRIQIDQFFDHQFIEILSKCASDLPSDILEKVVVYERAEKLNPPQDKREKAISDKVLQADSHQIRKEAEAKGIAFPISIQQDIKSLPLYLEEKSGSAGK